MVAGPAYTNLHAVFVRNSLQPVHRLLVEERAVGEEDHLSQALEELNDFEELGVHGRLPACYVESLHTERVGLLCDALDVG